MDTFFIFCAQYLFVLSGVFGLWWFYKLPHDKKKGALIFGALTLPLAFVFAKIASFIYTNPRPFVVGHFTPLIMHAADNGFPSDHTLLVSAIATVVTFVDIRRSIAFWLVAILVAISRVYVGLHHPLDVTTSAIIAALSGYIVHFALKYWRSRQVI